MIRRVVLRDGTDVRGTSEKMSLIVPGQPLCRGDGVHHMTGHCRPVLPPRTAMLPADRFAPPDVWIIDDADMRMPEHVQLYVAVDRIGNAHVKALETPVQPRPSFSGVPTSCSCCHPQASYRRLPVGAYSSYRQTDMLQWVRKEIFRSLPARDFASAKP